jgi:methyl-accepting chemotaxis protein
VPVHTPAVARKASAKPVRSIAPSRPALRTVGRGGAAPKQQLKASEENWEEF